MVLLLLEVLLTVVILIGQQILKDNLYLMNLTQVTMELFGVKLYLNLLEQMFLLQLELEFVY